MFHLSCPFKLRAPAEKPLRIRRRSPLGLEELEMRDLLTGATLAVPTNYYFASSMSAPALLRAPSADLPVLVADPYGDALASRLQRSLWLVPPQGTSSVVPVVASLDTANRSHRTGDPAAVSQPPAPESGHGLSPGSETIAPSPGATSPPRDSAVEQPAPRPEAAPREPRAEVAEVKEASATVPQARPTLPDPASPAEIQTEVKSVAPAGAARVRPHAGTLGAFEDSQGNLVAVPLLTVPSQLPLPSALGAASTATGTRVTAGTQPLLVADLLRRADAVLALGGIAPAPHPVGGGETSVSPWASVPPVNGTDRPRLTRNGTLRLRQGALEMDAEPPPVDLAATEAEDQLLPGGLSRAGTASPPETGRTHAPAAQKASPRSDSDADLAVARDLLIVGAVISLFAGSCWGTSSERRQKPHGRLRHGHP